jgi:transcriptional regulator with XRE-family HTH domain
MGTTSSGMPRLRSLAAAILKARKAANVSQREVAAKLGVVHTTLGRWEHGETAPTPAHLADLLEVLDVAADDRVEILALASEPPADWASAGISEQLAGVLECERDTRRMTEWAPLTIPAVLQTEAYARAIIGAGTLPAPQVDVQVNLRMGRGNRFVRAGGPRLTALIAEPVLHWDIAGPHAQADQLRHLLALAALDTVTIRLVPMGTAWHPGHAGPFVIYEFLAKPTIIHVEQYYNGVFMIDDDDVEAFTAAADRIAGVAMSPAASAERVAEILAAQLCQRL